MFKPLMPIYSHFVRSLVKGLLPFTCLMCGDYTQNTQNICSNCAYSLPILPHHCHRCAQFLTENPNIHQCSDCVQKPPAFRSTYALFPYEYPITSMIKKLKFQHQLAFAKLLGDLLIQRINSTWYAHQPLPHLIIPVPLHPQRLSERGFNQAIEIARPISKNLGLDIDYKGIIRIKNTKAQSGLSAHQRAQNLAQAFVVEGDYSGLTVAILDDVMTTGTTLRECSIMLKKRGAAHVDIWCCARRGLPK